MNSSLKPTQSSSFQRPALPFDQRKGIKLNKFTHLAFLIRRLIEKDPKIDLFGDEIFQAAGDGQLLAFLVDRFGHIADFYFLTSRPSHLRQMEDALRDAASGFDGRIDNPVDTLNCLGLVMDIVSKPCSNSSAIHSVLRPAVHPGLLFPPSGCPDPSKDFKVVQRISKDFKAKILRIPSTYPSSIIHSSSHPSPPYV